MSESLERLVLTNFFLTKPTVTLALPRNLQTSLTISRSVAAVVSRGRPPPFNAAASPSHFTPPFSLHRAMQLDTLCWVGWEPSVFRTVEAIFSSVAPASDIP